MNNTAICNVSILPGVVKCLRIIPAGLFRAIDGRPFGLSGWLLTANNAAQIIKLAISRKDDFVIDYEHQTMKAENNGQPAPAAGWFKRLEWREGEGLFAVDVRWTERAAAMIKAGEYRYFSPVFGFDGETGAVQFIQSAAITNYAALDGLTDIAAAKGQAVGASPATAAELDKTGAEHCKRVCQQTFGNQIPPVTKNTQATAQNPAFFQAGAVRHYGKTPL